MRSNPCWPSPGPTGVVVVLCLVAPGDPRADLIVDPKIKTKREATPARDDVPWALEIANPGNSHQLLQCTPVTGADGAVVGLRINWFCFPLGRFDFRNPVCYAIGDLQAAADKSWTIFYESTGSSLAVEVPVVAVWR